MLLLVSHKTRVTQLGTMYTPTLTRHPHTPTRHPPDTDSVCINEVMLW